MPTLGICVTVLIVLIKFTRNSVTKDDLRAVKDDLSNNIDALRSEMNRRFEEAADDRESIRAEAAADREKIRDEAAADQRQIRTKVMNARQAIEGEMSRQNQNYIEHLVYHNTRKSKPEFRRRG